MEHHRSGLLGRLTIARFAVAHANTLAVAVLKVRRTPGRTPRADDCLSVRQLPPSTWLSRQLGGR